MILGIFVQICAFLGCQRSTKIANFSGDRHLVCYGKYINKMKKNKHDEDSLHVECTGCGARMGNAAFNQHKCPATLPPRKGESFKAYKARSERWEFIPSTEPQLEDDNWRLKGTDHHIQVCAYGGSTVYATCEIAKRPNGETHHIAFSAEFDSLDAAIVYIEKKQIKRDLKKISQRCVSPKKK